MFSVKTFSVNMFSANGQPDWPDQEPAFEILEPAGLELPLVFNSPHSGTVYPQQFLASSRLDAFALRRSEDSHVDRLFCFASELGAPLMRARFPRCYLDVNREPFELDPRMFEGSLPPAANTRSIRVAGGLGTIPRLVGEGQEIYGRRLPVAEALARIEAIYRPYHRALSGLIGRARQQFGLAVLVDCHSMPSTPRQDDKPTTADIVIGDRYGTSCSPVFVDSICSQFQRLGYTVSRNKPYAGGFNTEYYGNPGGNCHAIQIEINRALYLDERTLEQGPGFEVTRRALQDVMSALAAQALHSCQPSSLAAE